jgi:hypothetical protein
MPASKKYFKSLLLIYFRFYRLLMTMLEQQCKMYGLPDFVSRLLMGTYAHTTQCKKCNTKSKRDEAFSQIELQLKVYRMSTVLLDLLLSGQRNVARLFEGLPQERAHVW